MEKLFNITFVLLLFTAITLFTGCSDDTNPTAPQGPNTSSYVYLGEQYAIGGRAKVMLYSGDSLFTGYNRIYLVLYDSLTNDLIEDAHIEFEPVDHGSGAPVENPDQNAVNGVFSGAVVFTEAQTTDDLRHWHFHIHVHNHEAPGEPEGEAEFEGFHIKDTPEKMFVYSPDTTTSYVFALIDPQSPVQGSNNFEILVSQKVGVEYQAFPWFTFTNIKVQEIGSGVLSTGNSDPITTGNGRYAGTINLPSSGTWNVKMDFSHSGVTNSGDFFQINLY
ncbi:MAG: hypothetical protein KDC73_02300 [Ignavibacteriae bacterium]|nr:hypothetical protein [Ignavibacteriota bacterium]MCB9244449.1 hypothetical protein [Ignavibacteriales bacterium]